MEKKRFSLELLYFRGFSGVIFDINYSIYSDARMHYYSSTLFFRPDFSTLELNKTKMVRVTVKVMILTFYYVNI